ncbi:tRNA lysidine(34) synthetase TilS [Ruminococcaceae bacterium OttesenSCG-928-A16]|nr:tRNA lysidine(34) synthetase TilS [Ruminococcaceae bacterium OttesenSCG-928-A16]
MENKVTGFIQKNNLLAKGDTVIVALSGGADSMALFHFLYARQQSLCITLLAAHLNHGLRGAEADRDEAFVKKVCSALGVQLFVRHAHMAQRKTPPGMGTEAFARELRYTFLQELAAQHNAKIATAHTFSDNAETVLFHAIRGAGPRGLAGIAPVRGNIVRPLLAVTRAEVEAYCQKNNVEYVTDSTNLETQFTRNRLRLQALPLLEEIQPGATAALGRMASDMRELDSWLTTLAEELLQKAATPGGYLPKILLAAPRPLRLQALASLCGPSSSRVLLAQVEQVLQGQLGAVTLPGKKTAKLQKGVFVLQPKAKPFLTIKDEFAIEEKEYQFSPAYVFQVQVIAKKLHTNFSPKPCEKGLTFWADYDKIAKAAVFRTRRAGDTFALPGRGVTKTIKKWMNEAGIPQHNRGCFPLLCIGNTVLWAYNVGFCGTLQVEDNTKSILQIKQIEHSTEN